MSAPKKGKDLSALKARLAKKASAATPSGDPGAAPRSAPPRRPASPTPTSAAQQASVQPPAAPMLDELGDNLGFEDEHVAPPRPQSPRSTARAEARVESSGAGGAGGDPFSGGAAFDPDDGLIGGPSGEFKPKSGLGLLAAGVLIGTVAGAMIGWVAHIGKGTREKVEVATNKAGQMIAEVEQVSQARKSLAIDWDSIKSELRTKPDAGIAKLKDVVEQHFADRYAKVDQLFGWQLGSMSRETIDSTFTLYRNAIDLKYHLNDLARLALNEGKLLSADSIPQRYAVVLNENEAQLVEFVHPICGDVDAGSACSGGRAKPSGIAVRFDIGGEVKNLPLDKVSLLIPKGPFYSAAISSNPKEDVRERLERILAKIDSDLETMNAAEKKTLDAFAKYKDSPTVDESSQQMAGE